jgi:hypothetical protein
MGGKRLGRKALEKKNTRAPRAIFLWIGLVFLLGLGIYGARRLEAEYQKRKAETVVERVVRSLSFRRVNEAFWLFSTRSREAVSRDDLQAMINDPEQFHTFSYYQPFSSRSTSWELFVRQEGEVPVRMMILKGSLGYQDGTTGGYEAELELEPGGWRLNHINVKPPPLKMRAPDFVPSPSPDVSASPSPPGPAKTGSGSGGSPPRAP